MTLALRIVNGEPANAELVCQKLSLLLERLAVYIDPNPAIVTSPPAGDKFGSAEFGFAVARLASF
jgi:hypothetical protein